ncbi:MAG: DUF6111 family protein [Pseudomonadota bacterium]
MIRVFAIHFSLFALPFVGYAIYLLLMRRLPLDDASNWSRDRVASLAIGGLFLTAASFLVLGHYSGASTDATYRPAELRDGVIVPGGFDEN